MVPAQHRPPDRPGDPAHDPGRGRRLGIDVGAARIGVACSDPDAILTTPVETVRRDRSGKHLRRLAALAAELEAVEVIVGLPRTLADRIGRSAQDAIELAEALARRVSPTPVRLADERLHHGQCSTIFAAGGGAGLRAACGDRPSGRSGNTAELAG